MKKILLVFFAVFSFIVNAQNNNPWTTQQESRITNNDKLVKEFEITNFQLFTLDQTALRNQLSVASQRGTSNQPSGLEVYFPDGKGTTSLYKVYEASVLHPDLALQFPEIKSYVAVNVNDKSSVIRFSFTLFGFHGMILSPSGTVFIDPYTKDLNNYVVYRKKDAVTNRTFTCLTEDESEGNRNPVNFTPRNAYDIESNTGIFRTYRLAMACTIEYAQYHWQAAGMTTATPELTRKGAVLAAMNVTMTRVNGLYERDMALTMVLVPNNLNIIFITSDNFNNTNANTLISQSQTVIDATIGSANYDIGHTVSTGGGGLASLRSPCTSGKARGITGSSAPVGDPFDIDYVAHEMGHQFGGNHTFNNSCGGNRNNSTAVEPGSGTTIMAYAGICAPNIQSNSDDHFHSISLAEMDAFVAGTGNCSANIANNNNAPVIEPIPNYTIPRSTAFVLPGNATDADGDTLTYCWEQTNTEISTQAPVATSTGGPNFRSLSPSLNPDRYMPNLPTILTGVTANTWEVVPSVARTMNFALVVRDNELVNGGQTARVNLVVTTAGSAGPFVVNSPNTNVQWLAGSNQTVTWDVAGTTSNGVDCPFVDIYLSQDGGATFPTLLASKVPNDGSELVSMPATTGTQNRIMIRGNKHIFLDVSNTNFRIITTTPTFALTFDGQPDGQNKSVCQGLDATYDLLYSTLGGFSGTTTFSVTGNPAGTTATVSPSSLSTNGTVQLLLTDTDLVTPGVYQMVVTGTSGSITKTVNIYVEIRAGGFQSITPISPVDMAYGVTANGNISWNSDVNATAYDYELASDVAFSTIIASGTINTTQFSYSNLSNLTNYFWRVLPKNDACSGELSPVFRFTTGSGVIICDPIVNSTNVPLTISTSGSPTVNSTLTIPTSQNQSISKVTIALNVTHTWMADLTAILISPLGTQIQLFSGQCGSRDNAVATFDDEGIVLSCQSTFPTITGTLIPLQPLSSFIGENSEGVWTLRIIDGANGDGGSINSWGITICALEETPIACGDLTSTWNGTAWSNGVPVNNVAAIINGDYTTSGDLECCSLAINNTAQVTVLEGDNLIVSGAVNVTATATLTLENNANLIQLENVQNSGEVTVNRETLPLMRLDYVMWSSPVTGSKTLKQFSPFTLDNRFYTYNTTNNTYNTLANPATISFEEGKGYLIRMPDNHPTNPTLWNGEFSGIAKNGIINVPIDYVSATQNFNLIGNPYPSTISAESFLSANQSDLEGIIYFWRKTNNASGTAYATYTLGGATTTSPTSPIPNGTIQVGQGFVVAAKNVSNPTVQFTNALRVDNNSNQFFRSNFGLPYSTQTSIERHRIWLNLTNDSGLFSQMMVGYMANASDEVDAFIDGKYIGDSEIALSSWLAEEEYVIQGKALPFETSDVVPLVFKTNLAGNYTIDLGLTDGLFAEGQALFLRDYLNGTVHDLRNAPYAFTSEIGVFSNRFELVYENTPLSLSDVDYSNTVIVATGSNQLKIKSTLELISKISVFDVLGRTLFESATIQNHEFSVPGLIPSNQALFVKIVINNGQTVIRKVIF